MIQLKLCLRLGFILFLPITERMVVDAAQVRHRQNDCGAQVLVTKVISVEPVYINTCVRENMTLAVNDHFSVTITDAPTSLDEVITDSTTKFITGAISGYSNVVYI
jgi:hypothetical protein